MSTRLHALHAAGQSLWLDYIDRAMLRNGDLARRIREDALTGMTSNPTIFEKALAEGDAYNAQLAALPAGMDDRDAFFALAASDVQDACDAFRGVYDATQAVDGYVSLEVSPDLARDAAGTVAEARRLWAAVDRPNLMIKTQLERADKYGRVLGLLWLDGDEKTINNQMLTFTNAQWLKLGGKPGAVQ